MGIISYLTKEEFVNLGYEVVEDFEKLEKRAETAINLYINNVYNYVDFETEIDYRQDAVKLATAFQVAYLDSSGIMTAGDKESLASVSLGHTSFSYKKSSQSSSEGSRYNLTLDAVNVLNGAGFGYRGVSYDRY